MSSIQLAGVVLTYHPPVETIDNVRAILNQVDHVFLVNNEFEEMDPIIASQLRNLERVTVIDSKKNVGVAAGFNLGMRAAFEYSTCAHVILFDQDSCPDMGMCQSLLNVANEKRDAGVIGPALRDRASKVIFKNSHGTGVAQRDVLISSGSLISRNLMELIGYHEECLFIDYVDHEYCLRSIHAGRKNWQVLTTFMDHQFGDSQAKKLFGKTVFPANYPPLRQYYMARNRIIVFKKYGWGHWLWSDMAYWFKSYVKTLLYEKYRWRKTVAIARGTWDGIWF